jgi:cytochrome P450
MLKHPEIQAIAQEEIDRVVGNSRLPSISDQPNLPYVNALINEILRCGPIAPMGFAHKLRADDVYNGYFLPKDSIIFGNIW